MAPSRHDWKIVDWDVKPQHNQIKHILFVTVAHTSWVELDRNVDESYIYLIKQINVTQLIESQALDNVLHYLPI